MLSIKEYLHNIRPYLGDMLNDHKTQDEWEIQLTIAISFFSFIDSKETRIMHSESENIEILIDNETDEIIEELFDSLSQKFQKGLEESMEVSEFVFDSVDYCVTNFIK